MRLRLSRVGRASAQGAAGHGRQTQVMRVGGFLSGIILPHRVSENPHMGCRKCPGKVVAMYRLSEPEWRCRVVTMSEPLQAEGINVGGG